MADDKGRSKKRTPRSASHLLGGGCNREDGLLEKGRPYLSCVYDPEDDEAILDLFGGVSERQPDEVDIAIMNLFGGGRDQHDRSILDDAKVGKITSLSSKKVRWFRRHSKRSTKSLISR